MKYKLSTILITLALIAGVLCACYPVMGDDGYRTMPLGTGTEAPVLVQTSPETTPYIPETTLSPVGTDSPDNTGADTTAESPDSTTAPDTAAEDTEPPIVVTYEFDVITKTEEIGRVGGNSCTATFRYPALKGLDDAESQKDINDLLAQIAAVEYQNRLPNASEIVKGGTIVDYEITSTSVTYLGNNIASVRSEGAINYSDETKDEKFVYCNLIKLSTGKDITLKKTYSDFGRVMELFTAGKFTQKTALPLSLTLEQMMEQYKYHSQYGTFPETYFTADSLVLVIDTNRENGFFAEFSIPLTEVNDCLLLSPIK